MELKSVRLPRQPGTKAPPPDRRPVQQAQLDRLRKLACLMSWTQSQLDKWIRRESKGKCQGLTHIRTAGSAEYLGECLDFFYVTRTQDYLARQRAMKKC